jgi:RNA polymerase sigma-70 factor (ECF subfamily)
MISESNIIEGCLNENKIYQRELYKRYSGKMMVVCLRYANSRMEAEDMLQDGFIKVFDNISKFKNKGSLEGWVRRIMVNTALNQIRTNRMKFEDISETKSYLTDNNMNAIDKLNEKVLLDIINKLPKGYKYVFNMFAIEGFSHKEIAEKLGIEEASSRSQYAKARKYLQQKINKLEWKN